jgi:hypothetical protein
LIGKNSPWKKRKKWCHLLLVSNETAQVPFKVREISRRIIPVRCFAVDCHKAQLQWRDLTYVVSHLRMVMTSV